MIPTIDYIADKFSEFNICYFGGRLPEIQIELFEAKSIMGECRFKKRILSNGNYEKYDYKLRFNARLDCKQNVLDDIILHEMIHYFISINELPDKTAHGPIFKAIMNRFNSAYGRNITISTKLSKEETKELINGKAKWHIIAVIEDNSGNVGIKVLPRTINRVLIFYRKLSAISSIKNVELYLHNNPYFNSYPTSIALRMYHIDRDELIENLKGAQRLKVNGDTIIRV